MEIHAKLGSHKKQDLRETWNACLWHGGPIFDVLFNAAKVSYGYVFLTKLPILTPYIGLGAHFVYSI